MDTRWLGFAVGFLLLGIAVVSAQTCRQVKTNVQNAGQCATISTAPVTIAGANTSRCNLLIYNPSSASMNCRDVSKDGAPSAALGMPVDPGKALSLALEGQGQWQCQRTGSSDATACVSEALP